MMGNLHESSYKKKSDNTIINSCKSSTTKQNKEFGTQVHSDQLHVSSKSAFDEENSRLLPKEAQSASIFSKYNQPIHAMSLLP